jgi:type IV pilus assembly protein PilW
MNESNLKTSHAEHHSQRGFTLVELMVAVTISVFLLGGLFATLQSTRQAYGNQNLLAQLQDNERLAMTVIATVVESTGYFPNPLAYTPATVFQNTDAYFPTAGMVIYGAPNSIGGPGDSISIRYAAGFNGVADNVYSCIGSQNTATNPYVVFENTFQLDANNQLVCTFNGINYPLITSNVTAGVTTLGLKNMTVLYGVKVNLADTGSCTDTYLTAAQVTAGTYWSSVCSAVVTLTFVNPMNPAGPGIPIRRVIALMMKAGVNS